MLGMSRLIAYFTGCFTLCFLRIYYGYYQANEALRLKKTDIFSLNYKLECVIG